MAVTFVRATTEAFFRKARQSDPKLFDRLMQRISRGRSDECWISKGATAAQPYGVIKIGTRNNRAHRVMYGLCFGTPKAWESVMHTCDNPPCCNPAHLRVGSHRENMADRALKGRGGDLKGENNGRAKINAADVLVIRSSSESAIAIARRFGISNVAVHNIRKRKSWRHL